MDAELLELQEQFKACQETKASLRLSERNVVELVTKLQELGLVDSDLLYTIHGKEYLTQDQLRTEMEVEIQRLGRVSMIDLAATIGVDLFYIEKQAKRIVSSNSDLMLVQGEILSASYWDSVAEEINENLQETGHLSLAELAGRLNVGVELLTAIIDPRFGKLIQGKLEGGKVYTQSYVARLKVMIRGAVRAVLVPTNLSSIWLSIQSQLQEMDENAISGASSEGVLFQTLFNGLLKEGTVMGSLRVGGSLWIPSVFAQAQREGVESFYSQNSYVSYDALRKLAIPQPKSYLQMKYPDGFALETVFVHPSLMSMVDAAADEAIEGGGWVDCQSIVPVTYAAIDTAKLILLCPSVQQAQKESRAIIMAETCIVSNILIKSLIENFESEAQHCKNAQSDSNQIKLSACNSGKQDSVEDDTCNFKVVSTGAAAVEDKKTTGMQGGTVPQIKSGKTKVINMGHSKPMTDEGEMTFDKVSKGRKKSGKTKGNKSGKEAPTFSKEVKSKSDTSFSNEDDFLPEEEMEGKILKWYPDMEDAGAGEDSTGTLAQSLSAYIRPSVLQIWKVMRQARFTAAAEERRRKIDTLQKKLDEGYANLQLFTKALDIFEDDKSTLAVLQRHLLRTTATEIADFVLVALDSERRLEDESCGSSETAEHHVLNSAQRISLANNLDISLKSKAIKMIEALDGKSIEAFESALEDLASERGLRMKMLDKKAEKAHLHSYCQRLAFETREETDPVALLPKVVGLLYAQVYNKAVQAPGRAMAAAVGHLKKGLPDAAYAILAYYHSSIVALLSMMSTASPGGTDCTADRIQERREYLETEMPRLKQIVLMDNGSILAKFS